MPVEPRFTNDPESYTQAQHGLDARCAACSRPLAEHGSGPEHYCHEAARVSDRFVAEKEQR